MGPEQQIAASYLLQQNTEHWAMYFADVIFLENCRSAKKLPKIRVSKVFMAQNFKFFDFTASDVMCYFGPYYIYGIANCPLPTLKM